MADLTDAQAAQTIKIVGSNPSSGVEDNFAEVDSNGQVKSVNPSEGTKTAVAPSVAIQIAGPDQSGNLQAPSVHQLGTQVISTDQGIVTNSVLHGLTTAGGGSYVDVKVNPSGSLATQDGADGTTGSAVPSLAIQVGGTDGTNLRAIATDTSGNQKVVGNVADGTADSGNTVKVGGVFDSTLPTYTNGQRAHFEFDQNGRAIVSNAQIDGYKTTYNATATFTAANTATDIFTINGSATKTVRVLRIGISATQTTSSEIALILLKRSTANTGGTSSTLTNVSYDSTNAAATASVKSYTANPTALGTLVGNLRNIKFSIPVVAIGGNASAQTELVESFGNGPGQALVLRGTAESLAVNLNSATVSGNSFSIWVEWTEE